MSAWLEGYQDGQRGVDYSEEYGATEVEEYRRGLRAADAEVEMSCRPIPELRDCGEGDNKI